MNINISESFENVHIFCHNVIALVFSRPRFYFHIHIQTCDISKNMWVRMCVKTKEIMEGKQEQTW